MSAGSAAAVTAVIAIAMLVILVLVVRRVTSTRASSAYALRPVPGDLEQYTATTPAGPAVVTKVWEENTGWSYEIETHFRGATTQRYYVAPSRVIVQNRLQNLAFAHPSKK